MRLIGISIAGEIGYMTTFVPAVTQFCSGDWGVSVALQWRAYLPVCLGSGFDLRGKGREDLLCFSE